MIRTQNVTTTSYIAIGSNLGERERFLRDAVRALDSAGGNNVIAVSPVYESEALVREGERHPPYLNAVVGLSTRLTAISLLVLCHDTELQAGRVRDGRRWSPRTLDLDILTFGSAAVQSPALTIPHPGLSKRLFVLQPFADIAPDLILPPPINCSVIEALAQCSDTLSISPYPHDVFNARADADDHGSAGILADSEFDPGGDLI